MIIPHAVFVALFSNPKMKRWLNFPSVQIALCTVCCGLLGYWLSGSVIGRVMLIPVIWGYGAAVSRPLINLVANFRHGMRSVVWLPVHGTHYVFKDTTIHVLEDDENWRWLPLADQPARMHMRDDALIAHLSKLSDPMALRFRTWLERNIALPARRTRQRAAGQAVDSF